MDCVLYNSAFAYVGDVEECMGEMIQLEKHWPWPAAEVDVFKLAMKSKLVADRNLEPAAGPLARQMESAVIILTEAHLRTEAKEANERRWLEKKNWRMPKFDMHYKRLSNATF